MSRNNRRKALRKRTIGCLVRQVQYLLVVISLGLLLLGGLEARRRGFSVGLSLPHPPATPTAAVVQAEPMPAAIPTASTTVAAPTITPASTSAPGPTSTFAVEACCYVGILAGHSGPQNDPGAMCDDGLREAEINLKVAEAVVNALTKRGYRVDLLNEYDARLDGYRADAFVSIHSDSCQVPEASGFKVARVSFSAIPDTEDFLVECLNTEYQQATGLQRHDLSITPNMHQYYAFSKIHPQTPGAIIELGFLGADRDLLVNGDRRMVDGIVSGITCFLDRQAQSTATD